MCRSGNSTLRCSISHHTMFTHTVQGNLSFREDGSTLDDAQGTGFFRVSCSTTLADASDSWGASAGMAGYRLISCCVEFRDEHLPVHFVKAISY